MEYFQYLSASEKQKVFFKEPSPITKYDAKEKLSYAVGAALYMPAIRRDISGLIINQKYKEVSTIVLDLEDAVGDNRLAEAVDQTIAHFEEIERAVMQGVVTIGELPLIFIRVRSANQLREVSERLGTSIEYLTGFVFPKISSSNAELYFSALEEASNKCGVRLYSMPILESPELMYKETRFKEFQYLSSLFQKYESSILNVRIGATDLCGLYGIRRNAQTPIYDISIMRDFISDVVNYFGRDFIVSGPVWEYFDSKKDGLNHALSEVNEYNAGLLNETLLDLSNGLTGKTVIHPSHIKVVQSVNVVTKEEYHDALSIIENASGEVGVLKSASYNKMNEIKPHYKWAMKIITKSDIYGVYHEQYNFLKMLTDTIPFSNLVGDERESERYSKQANYPG
ncbi:HpcH/HpaI aldolase/citrate lyase family protein [Pseudalkalibacillus hwajinpoensis]|uniref:Citrate lyase subunit beta n=1 Tax=Guptibacillus hwajinpoensis TaxID=208199 RepID=A0A4U1MD56_9BACL|nr:HpcH/HpaI aldolase/citrate lyase family protein [Pseudalkalibacillus hwajinpoensis]TKD68265.1 citrate lyase subunit beta [Pseudalkalibacillus hwajinpoensis]